EVSGSGPTRNRPSFQLSRCSCGCAAAGSLVMGRGVCNTQKNPASQRSRGLDAARSPATRRLLGVLEEVAGQLVNLRKARIRDDVVPLREALIELLGARLAPDLAGLDRRLVAGLVATRVVADVDEHVAVGLGVLGLDLVFATLA